MKTFQQWVNEHHQKAPHDDLRMGQRFVNEYGMEPDDRIFNVPDDVAINRIQSFLIEFHYMPHMPNPVRKS